MWQNCSPSDLAQRRICLQEDPTDSAEEDDKLVSGYQQRIQQQQSGEAGSLVTMPAVCQQAVKERRAEQLAIALTYNNAEVAVELVDKANLHDPPGDHAETLATL